MKPPVTEIIWKEIPEVKENEVLIEKVLQKCFEVERINPTSFYVCVTLTNPKQIQKINKQYRQIDKPTDVLSFPMFEKDELDKLTSKSMLEQDKMMPGMIEGVGQEVLGDIIISTEKVEEQAKEYGHSFERELAYMVVHGFYHLRGYDHIIEEEKSQMREKEEKVLSELNITK